jgi:hypothetical protein
LGILALGGAAQGLANKLIAGRLSTSESTVKVHIGSIFRRIGVRDRTSAACGPGKPHRAGRHLTAADRTHLSRTGRRSRPRAGPARSGR